MLSSKRRQFIKKTILLAAAMLAGGSLFAAGSKIHRVRRGDTLGKIARRYNTTVSALKKANGLRSDKIVIGKKLKIPDPDLSSYGATITYTVKRGDTLSGIANTYDSSVTKIKNANGLRNDTIQIGKELLIPVKSAPRKYISSVIKRTARMRIKRNRWKHIVVHHSGVHSGNARSYDRYHKRRGMKNGLAYHFVIGNGVDSGDGSIAMGNRWIKQLDGGHVKSYSVNKSGIGICLVGNFEKTRPTKKQMEALYELITYLKKEVISNSVKVAVHREIDGIKHTVCPGRNFPIKSLHKRFPA